MDEVMLSQCYSGHLSLLHPVVSKSREVFRCQGTTQLKKRRESTTHFSMMASQEGLKGPAGFPHPKIPQTIDCVVRNSHSVHATLHCMRRTQCLVACPWKASSRAFGLEIENNSLQYRNKA